MISYTKCLLILFVAAVAQAGCGSGGTGKGSGAEDAGTDGSAGSDGGDADADSDAGADSDAAAPGEEMPKDLPGLCRAAVSQASASEADDYYSPDKGDGRSPDISTGDTPLIVWAYYASAADSRWEIRTAPFDPREGGMPGPGGGQPGPIQNPATQGPVSVDPSLAARGERFGIVWRDGRWDPACTRENIKGCTFDLAFLEVDHEGKPVAGADPLPLTEGADIWVRPAIAATASGYVVSWVQPGADGSKVMARAIFEDGTLGNPYTISSIGDVERDTPPALAAIGDTVVIVWGLLNQSKIIARMLNGSAKPGQEMIDVDEGIECVNPRVAAGSDRFLVSWSKMRDRNLAVYTRLLDPAGALLGPPRRITWTPDDVNVKHFAPAWNGANFALAWLSTHNNGKDDCVVEACKDQVFSALLDDDGALASDPVILSNKEPNSATNLALAWDKEGFSAVWELPRGQSIETFRQQVFYGRMLCLDPSE